MVVERHIPDFWAWLLGAGWREGALFPWVMYLAAAVVLGAAAWAALVGFGVARVRLTPAQGRRIGRVAAYACVGGALLVAAALAVLARGHSLAARVKAVEAAGQMQIVDAATGDPISGGDRLAFALFGALSKTGARLLGEGWTEAALYQWLAVAALVAVAVLLAGILGAILRHGPVRGLEAVDRTLADVAVELLRLSPRRVWALTRLGVQEAVRRRAIVGFALFLLLMLFAGWYLDTGSADPSRLYLSFVLTTTSYLMLPLALLLSTFSLPGDIRTKTIHTVVTKPVRSSEIVLGRMLGFTLVGTGLLAVMAGVSYVFVVRGLSHTHELDPQTVAEARLRAGEKRDFGVLTNRVHNHRHQVVIDADGNPALAAEHGHWHDIIQRDDGTYEISGPRGDRVARVPVYGKLRFLDRQGQPTDKGINVGDEWEYRSYIEGRTGCAAIWTFEGVTPERFAEGIPLEMTLGVFRTWKGDIEQGVRGSISVRNPDTGVAHEVVLFTAKEFQVDSHFIPQAIEKRDVRLDLFEDVVSNGRLEIVLRCLDGGQCLGVAQGDLYIRADDAPFELNYVKGYLGIWLQMVLVIGLGVTLSTFLSTPVAMVATGGALALGFFSDFMYRLATGQTYGGGPVESLIRMVTQENVISELEVTPRTVAAKMMDEVANMPLWATSKLLPRFGDFDWSDFVAGGFNVSADLVAANCLSAAGFLLPAFVLGYLFLKTREVAR